MPTGKRMKVKKRPKDTRDECLLERDKQSLPSRVLSLRDEKMLKPRDSRGKVFGLQVFEGLEVHKLIPQITDIQIPGIIRFNHL